MSYSGPERRQHRILVTRNTEYHLRGELCVGVKAPAGGWDEEHRAVGCVLEGGIGVNSNGGFFAKIGSDLEPGFRLCFSGDVLTSPLLSILRTPKDVVDRYAA